MGQPARIAHNTTAMMTASAAATMTRSAVVFRWGRNGLNPISRPNLARRLTLWKYVD